MIEEILETKIKGIKKDDEGNWSTITQSNFSYREQGHVYIGEIEAKSFWYYHRNRSILSCLKKSEPDWILDIGGGNGIVSELLEQNHIQSLLVEPGIDGVSHARRRKVKYIIHGSIHDLIFEDNSIPNVGLFDVLEHIELDIELLKTIYLFMKPGGRLFLTVPAYNWLWSKNDDDVGHFRRYTRKALKRELVPLGFDVEYSTYLFWVLPLFILLFRKLLYRKKIRQKIELEHLTKARISNHIMIMILEIEKLFIHLNLSFPFGSTCLVVARKRVN